MRYPVRRRTARTVAPVLSALLLTLLGPSAQAFPPPAAGPASPPAGPYTLDYLTGPENPEDLAVIPGDGRVVASGMSADPMSGAEKSGHLYAVDPDDGSTTEIWPDRSHGRDWDRETFGSCPGPPDPSQASPHGINIEARADGASRLYVVNHGGREAVEVFDIRPGSDLGLTWVGCVVMPPGTFPNGVAPVPGGEGLVATNFFDPSDPDAFTKIFQGEPTGDVRRWSPEEGWSTVPGSGLAGPNGIEVSPNGRWALVASWGGREIHRIPLTGRADHAAHTAAKLPYMPDNLRWTRSGDLLVTGQDITHREFLACQSGDTAGCPTGFAVHVLDPRTMRATPLYASDTADFGLATVATEVGEEIWTGSVRGEKIARLRPAQP